MTGDVIEYKAVAHAAGALIEAGCEPTPDAVHDALGRGSIGAIAPLLDRWAAEQESVRVPFEVCPLDRDQIGLTARLVRALPAIRDEEAAETPSSDVDWDQQLLRRILDDRERLHTENLRLKHEILERDAAALSRNDAFASARPPRPRSDSPNVPLEWENSALRERLREAERTSSIWADRYRRTEQMMRSLASDARLDARTRRQLVRTIDEPALRVVERDGTSR